MNRALLLATACVVAACETPLNLPAAPEVRRAPVIEAFSPTSGHAGTRLEIVGKDLDGARVRFGTSASVEPASLTSERLVVIVPEDIGAVGNSVSVSVTTGIGTAEAATPFLYRGAGRLRSGRVWADVDMQPRLSAALWLPREGEYFVASETFGRGAVNGEANPCEGPGLERVIVGATRPTALARGTFAVLERATDRDLSVRLCGAHVERIPLGSFSGLDGYGRRMASDEKGDLLGIVKPGQKGVFIVDVTTTPATVRTIGPPTPDDQVFGIAAYPGGGFIVGTLGGFRRLEPTEEGWAYSARHASNAGFIDVIDAVPGCVLASDNGLLVYGLDTWPPVLRSTIAREYEEAILSEDCARVGVPTRPSFVTWDVTRSSARIVGGTPIESALGAPSRGPDATFVVPTVDSVVVVAAQTGTLVESIPVALRLSNPALRTAELMRGDGVVARAPVVEVAVSLFDVLFRFDAGTPSLASGAILPLPASVLSLTTLQTGGEDVLIAERRSVADLIGPERLDALSPALAGGGLGGFDVDSLGPKVAQDATGRGVPLLLEEHGERGEETRIRLLDPARFAAGEPLVELIVDGYVLSATWLDDGTVALSVDDELRVLDAEALLAGRLELRRTIPLDSSARTVTIGPEGHVATLGSQAVAWISPDGTVRSGTVPGLGSETLYVIPGGRRALSIASGGLNNGGQLRTFSLDPDGITLDPLQIPMPPAPSWAMTKDGERLFVVSEATAHLTAYE